MTEILRRRSLRELCTMLMVLASIFLQFASGIADDSSNSKNGDSEAKSNSNTRSKILVILIGVLAVGLVLFFLFKLWQKKRRDEQYARLLKLFEEDDELELELGLRE